MSRCNSQAHRDLSSKQTVPLPQPTAPSWQRRVLLIVLLASFSGGCSSDPTTPVEVPSGDWAGVVHAWRESAEQHTFGLLLNEHRGTISGRWRLARSGVPLYQSAWGEVTGRYDGRVTLTLHAESGGTTDFGSFQGSLVGSSVLRGSLRHNGHTSEVSLLKIRRTGGGGE